MHSHWYNTWEATVPRAWGTIASNAVAGRELTQRAYAAATEARYLWHEFGDSALLLPAAG